MARQENLNGAKEIQQLVENEFSDLLKVPGDFETVRRLVDVATLSEIENQGLVVPTASAGLRGVHEIVSQLPTTTSAGLVTAGGLVVKTLREPAWRVPGLSNGKVFSNDEPHFLFPWEAKDENSKHIGIRFQEAALVGELRAGVLYNPNYSPYMGMMGVEDTGDGSIRLTSIENVSAEEKIWPALIMEELRVDLTPSKVLLDWVAGDYPELNEGDIVAMLALAVKSYQDKGISASDDLKNMYGSIDFFKRCLVKETPNMTANMVGDKVVNAAAEAAKEMVAITAEFIDTHSEYIEEKVRDTVIIGHADSKHSNTAIGARDKGELVEMIKGREIPFRILDAQSLAVNEGIMHKSKGIDYAHWRVVPEVQQPAYSSSQLVGMELHGIGNQVNEQLGLGEFSDPRDEAWFELQVAYKTSGVEPLVRSAGWMANQANGKAQDEMTKLTMTKFPRTGLEKARRAAKIVGLSQDKINARLSK